MDYWNKESVNKTLKSYMAAFNEIVKLCPNLEPSANESNSRIVLPTTWQPSFGFKEGDLIQHCNWMRASHESLFDYRQPKIITKSMWIWGSYFFKVYWGISIPFSMYAWDMARQVCEEGGLFNDEGNCLGRYKLVPAQMCEWCSPQYLTLEVTSHSGHSWGLKDWHNKYNEIYRYFKEAPISIQNQYQKVFEAADYEVTKWETAIADLAKLEIPRGGQDGRG